jgi:hypothetical protein
MAQPHGGVWPTQRTDSKLIAAAVATVLVTGLTAQAQAQPATDNAPRRDPAATQPADGGESAGGRSGRFAPFRLTEPLLDSDVSLDLDEPVSVVDGSGGESTASPEVQPVPLPATAAAGLAMLGCMGGGALFRRWRRRAFTPDQ